MSAEEPDNIGQVDFALVADITREPSYISEIARKLRALNMPAGYDEDEINQVETIQRTWGDITENSALSRVMFIVSELATDQQDKYDVYEYTYDKEEFGEVGDSQMVGSPHITFSQDGFTETNEWKPYQIIHNTGDSDSQIGSFLDREGYQILADRLRENVNETVTPGEKLEIIDTLSTIGNEVSIYAEEIMQDVMKRQFRYYDVVETSGYNSPGSDFKVKDEDRRDYGLVVEVSVRWVNPIGEPYVSSKVNQILEMEEESIDDQPWDVVILAPKFSATMRNRYEDPDDPDWHSEPNEGMVHLHRVPTSDPDVYYPFATKPDDVGDVPDKVKGNPVIIPDNERLRERIQESGHVGDSYPVVDDDYVGFRRYLERTNRNFSIVSESRYRNMLREAIEPLLWEFLRPYKIEQFLIDMYWDRELNQSEVGRLVHRSGSTIGQWMRNWGVMRRGTGAPELSDEVLEIWRRMYEGEDPFPKQFSGYRIQAEYNRHPLWTLDDWRDWYQNRTFAQRQETVAKQDSFRESLDYTVMVGAKDRLQPSYTFILQTLRDMGVEIRAPDEAPRVPYSAYPDRKALEYMLNKNQNTIVDVSEQEE